MRWRLAYFVADERPELLPAPSLLNFRHRSTCFGDAEPWIEKIFDFDGAANRFGDYSLAFKHIVANHMESRVFTAVSLSHLAEKVDCAVVSGVEREIFPMSQEVFGSRQPQFVRPALEPSTIFNFLQAMLVVFYLVLWTIFHTRLVNRSSENIFLGLDFIDDDRLFNILDEVSDAPGPLMVVFRNKAMRDAYLDTVADWRSCIYTDGRFGPVQGASALIQGLVDICRLFPVVRKLPSDIAWHVIKLPLRRIMYKALLNRYRFQNFWARDDYNPEHILRGQELRRIGGKHFGQLHGLPVSPPVISHYRHIDLDIYYLFGRDYAKFYKTSWRTEMKAEAAGSFGFTRARQAQAATQRPTDIIYFLTASRQEEGMLNQVAEIAQAFPERTLFVKPKARCKSGPLRRELDLALSRCPNLVETNESPYDLVLKARYVLSDPSSLVAESIQFGCCTFAFHPNPGRVPLYFEEFPDLCVTTGREFIERVRAIEDGSRPYLPERYAGLIEMSEPNIWDRIRVEMGMVPRKDLSKITQDWPGNKTTF